MASFSKPRTVPNSLLPSTTALSPYLSLGCLSVRTFYHRLSSIYAQVNEPRHLIMLSSWELFCIFTQFSIKMSELCWLFTNVLSLMFYICSRRTTRCRPCLFRARFCGGSSSTPLRQGRQTSPRWRETRSVCRSTGTMIRSLWRNGEP